MKDRNIQIQCKTGAKYPHQKNLSDSAFPHRILKTYLIFNIKYLILKILKIWKAERERPDGVTDYISCLCDISTASKQARRLRNNALKCYEKISLNSILRETISWEKHYFTERINKFKVDSLKRKIKMDKLLARKKQKQKK